MDSELKENDNNICFSGNVACYPIRSNLSHPAGRIVGGEDANPGEYPWMAALLRRSSSPRERPFCGGSLISPIHVLTAAHCVVELHSPIIFVVRIGEHDFEREFETKHEDFSIRRVHVHPDYKKTENAIYDDVAVLELESSCMKEPRTVCLPDDPGDFRRDTAIVLGWGRSLPKGDHEPILQEVLVSIYPNEECQFFYEGITSTHLCAGDHVDGGKDSCKWDSGGPLQVRLEGKWVQVGIVSYGEGCARPQKPGVYVNVSSHLSWIASVIHNYTLNVTIATGQHDPMRTRSFPPGSGCPSSTETSTSLPALAVDGSIVQYFPN
ncbi:unnamed protein product, partial [Darwinula stevensoni]